MESEYIEVESVDEMAEESFGVSHAEIVESVVAYLLLGGLMTPVGQAKLMKLYGVFLSLEAAEQRAAGIFEDDRWRAIDFREKAVVTHLGYPAYHKDVIAEMAPMRALDSAPRWHSNGKGGKTAVNESAANYLRIQAVPMGRVFGKRPWLP